jgi:hypothetical protein
MEKAHLKYKKGFSEYKMACWWAHLVTFLNRIRILSVDLKKIDRIGRLAKKSIGSEGSQKT